MEKKTRKEFGQQRVIENEYSKKRDIERVKRKLKIVLL